MTLQEINEDLKPIEISDTDFISKSGKIYKRIGINNYILKSIYKNKYNGYLYCAIHKKEGGTCNRRVHNLLAKAFIPNPKNYPLVMHLDNNKLNLSLFNLKWGNSSQNTKQAYKDGLAINKKRI